MISEGFGKRETAKRLEVSERSVYRIIRDHSLGDDTLNEPLEGKN